MITDKSTAFVFTHLHRAFAALYEKYHMAEVGIQKRNLNKSCNRNIYFDLNIEVEKWSESQIISLLSLYSVYIWIKIFNDIIWSFILKQ